MPSSSISSAGFDGTSIFTLMSSVILAKGPRPNSDFHMASTNCRMSVAAAASLAEYKASVSNSSPLALSPRAVLKIDSASLPPKTCSLRRYHHQDPPAATVALCATPRATGSAIFSVAGFTRGSSLLMSGRTSASTDRIKKPTSCSSNSSSSISCSLPRSSSRRALRSPQAAR